MAMEESTEMEEIVTILIEDEELIKNWKGLADSLGLGIEDSVILKNLYKQSTTTATDFFSEILSRWRSVKGQGATISKLVETLEGLDFKGIAEKIEATLNIANKAELLTNPIEHDVLKWNASIEDILKNGETGALAIELLNLISYFDADGIDFEFLKAIHRGTFSNEEERDDDIYEKAVSLVQEYSLLKCENKLISIHQLDQEVTRVNCSSSNLEEPLLRQLVQSITTIRNQLKQCDMPHVLSASKAVLNHDEIVRDFSAFPCNIIITLRNLSLYREMLDFANLSYRRLSNILGEKHSETLRMKRQAAMALECNGKYEEALQKYTVLHEEQRSVFGGDDPTTLVTGHNLAWLLYRVQRYDEALETFKSVLESRKKVLGGNHRETIVTKGSMAIVLSSQGKYREAMELQEEVLEWRKKELGKKDLQTLTARHNIGVCLYAQEELIKARGIFEEVLELELKGLGEEHSSTLATKHMLASTLHRLGESEEGLKMLKEVLASMEKVLGSQHPQTIMTRKKIDIIISLRTIPAQPVTKTDPPVRVSERTQTTLNPANEAEDGEELSFPLNTTEQEHGLTNLVTWDASVVQIRKNGETGTLAIELLNLISYFDADGIDFEFLKAIHRGTFSNEEERDDDIYEKAVSLVQEYSLLKCENKLISIHQLDQEVTRVNCSSSNLEEPLLRQLVQSITTIRNQLKQRDMPHVLSASKAVLNHAEIVRDFSAFPCNIIITLRNLSLYREMLDFANLSYRRLSNILGEKHSETLRMKRQAAMALECNGKYEEALQKLTVLHEEQRSVFGGEDPTTLVTGHYLAWLLYRVQRYDEALETFKSVLESRKKVLGGNHPQTIETKEGMAIVLSSQGKYREAMELQEEVLEWRKKELGKEDLQTLTARHNIGVCLYTQEELIKARGIFEEVLELELKVLGEEHSLTLSTKYVLACTLHRLGESGEWLKTLNKVLASQEEVLGHEHPQTIMTRESIDGISRCTIPAQPVTKPDSSVRVSAPTENTTDVGSTCTGGGSSRSRDSTNAPPGTGGPPKNYFAELPGLNRETLDERMATTIPSLAENDQGGQDERGDEQQPPKKKYKSQ